MSTNPFAAMRSDIPGIEWPPISNGPPAVLAAVLRQLEDTQWLPPGKLQDKQFRQLRRLAEHSERHSPHFRRRLHKAGLKAADLALPEGLRRLPVMRRRELQAAKDLFCKEVPDGHAPLSEMQTSGSTGEPVAVMRSQVSNFFWHAYTLRDHFWHKRDFRKRFCAIRADVLSPMRSRDWGRPVNFLFESGPALVLPINTSIEKQIEAIREFAPDGLLIYPSNLAALVRQCAESGIVFPGLSHIRTMGETLSRALREEAQKALGAEVQDCYSSREIGNIALECPDAVYHVMESVILEILDEDGRPCPEGQAGRVALTDLHNFATPLVRYDIGDYAEAGPPCSCGRGLPTLRRIHGRERNLIRMPDGTRHWPTFGMAEFRDIAPVVQFQFIQKDREAIEARFVVARPLDADEENALTSCVQKALGHPFALHFVYFDGELPKGPNGKFEEFVCALS